MDAEQARVLVVDDDHDCRLVLCTIVAQAGYHVDAVADGRMALAMLQNNPPDIVLLDAHLPGIDGWEVCRSIKSTEQTQQMPVIMLTAFASPQNQTQSMEAGADEFVPKPFRADELLQLIQRFLAAAPA